MAKKRKKRPSHQLKRKGKSIQQIQEDLKQLFLEHPGEAYGYRYLIGQLGIKDTKSKKIIKDYLFSLEAKGELTRDADGRFRSDVALETYIGKVDHVNARFAYVVVDQQEEDIWVKTEDLMFAIDEDIVEIQLTKRGNDHKRPEGKVIQIVQRSKKEIVGRIETSDKFSFVVPDSRSLHFDIFVYPEKTAKARHNDKVMVRINQWHDKRNRSPMGEVIAVLGQAGEHEAEIHSIMAEFGLPFQFSKKVEEAAQKIPREIDPQELAYRKDFRSTTTFTIDPLDAKDFDDALSLKNLDNGRFEIGIHIADVTHYVRPRTLLEKEAATRATSVYLVDRTIPMLPEALSNGLCSLRPLEEKLTFSAVFELDKEGVHPSEMVWQDDHQIGQEVYL